MGKGSKCLQQLFSFGQSISFGQSAWWQSVLLVRMSAGVLDDYLYMPLYIYFQHSVRSSYFSRRCLYRPAPQTYNFRKLVYIMGENCVSTPDENCVYNRQELYVYTRRKLCLHWVKRKQLRYINSYHEHKFTRWSKHLF